MPSDKIKRPVEYGHLGYLAERLADVISLPTVAIVAPAEIANLNHPRLFQTCKTASSTTKTAVI